MNQVIPSETENRRDVVVGVEQGMGTYKLHMKVGGNEFHGEGPEDAVKRDFEEWKLLIGSLCGGSALAPTLAPAVTSGAGTDVEQGQWPRIFLLDSKSGLVTLRMLPRGDDRDKDAVLLILLGYKLLKKQDEVLVTQLKPALRQSGCMVDRVDSVASAYVNEGLLNKGGMAKGGRYSLTNSGIQRANVLALGFLS